MVKRSPVMKLRVARCASSSAKSGSVARIDSSMTAASRCSGATRTSCTKAPPLARFSVVCCQSIQRSASKRSGNCSGYIW